MAFHNSSPDTSTAVVEGGARKSDQLASEITSDNNVSANAVKFHPLADMFPLMEGADFDKLVADIKANGLRERILLYDGMILDGRNRYLACIAAGVGIHYWNYQTLCGGQDPLAYVISANIHRLHYTPEQKRNAGSTATAMTVTTPTPRPWPKR